MRTLDDPELLAYLTAENTYADAWFDARSDTIDTIFEEIKSRIQETDMSVPVFSGGWWYVTSTIEGSSYPIHHRGPTAGEATSEILLDENVEAEGHDYFDVGAFDLSHDHTQVAWSFDTDGDEHYTLHIRDLATGDGSQSTTSSTCATPAPPGHATGGTCSTSPPTSRSGRTGSGGTRSVRGRPTPSTRSSSRRPTSGTSSASARPGPTTS